MIGQRILLLVPHPDDEIVGCATAIGRARADGASVALCYLTNGVPERSVLFPWQRRRHAAWIGRRWQEAMEAARRLGVAEAGRLDIATRTLKSHFAQAEALIARALAETSADTLWTPAYEGGHQDHDAANFLASRCTDRAAVWEFSEYNRAGGVVRGQTFFDARGGEREIALTPDERATKRALLAVYASERGNLQHIGMRFERESFRPLPAHDYASAAHPGRQFYQRFQWVPYHSRIDRCRPHELSEAIAQYVRTAPAAPEMSPRRAAQ